MSQKGHIAESQILQRALFCFELQLCSVLSNFVESLSHRFLNITDGNESMLVLLGNQLTQAKHLYSADYAKQYADVLLGKRAFRQNPCAAAPQFIVNPRCNAVGSG